jgi:hypothetical protein
VVVDEIQHRQELFRTPRVLADRQKRPCCFSRKPAPEEIPGGDACLLLPHGPHCRSGALHHAQHSTAALAMRSDKPQVPDRGSVARVGPIMYRREAAELLLPVDWYEAADSTTPARA